MRKIRKQLKHNDKVTIQNDNDESRNARPLSPCILICTLDDDKRCLGCGRTLVQISSWALMSVAQQWGVIDQLAVRDGENGVTIAYSQED